MTTTTPSKPVPELVAQDAVGGVFGLCAFVAGFAFHWPLLLTAIEGVAVGLVAWYGMGLFYSYARRRGFDV
jgi:hypothetical protein